MQKAFLGVVAALQFSTLLWAQTDAMDKSLIGLTAVAVTVDPLEPGIEREGLSRNQIQKEAELRLKEGGIKILAPKESLAAPGQPQVYIGINLMKGSTGIYTYSLEVSLQERVRLERDPQATVTGTIWSTGSIGVVGAAKIGGVITKILDLVDDFIQAWRAMNPKKQVVNSSG